MELKYRGVSYEANLTSVKIAGKKNQVTFRGCSYLLSSAVVNLPHKSHQDITYRGVSLRDTQEKRFLGQTYQSSKICLAPMMA